MLSISLCVVFAALCFFAGRQSLVNGIGAALAVGYAYGIARANLPQTGSHFFFDSAVAGLFAARLTVQNGDGELRIPRQLLLWVAALIAWPLFLLAVPKQDTLVQLVGLRGNAFLLPFILLGAQLTNDARYRLALWCAALNIVAFGFAAAEYQLGLPVFFPRNVVTTIIYMSNDVVGHSHYRIPSTFGSAHAYGGTMVVTLPIILGAWLQPRKSSGAGMLIAISILAASVGVFMSATRTGAFLWFVFIGFATLSARMTMLARAGWLSLLAMVAILVTSEARLQRFMSLTDAGSILERVGWSVNATFVDLALKYPFGNGLGGGGTSIPFFLTDRIQQHEAIENEYGRIMMEQGMPGLALWLAFILWIVLRRQSEQNRGWRSARLLAYCVIVVGFATSVIGTGLLTSVPHTAIFLLTVGWISTDGRLNATASDTHTADRNALLGVPRIARLQ